MHFVLYLEQYEVKVKNHEVKIVEKVEFNKLHGSVDTIKHIENFIFQAFAFLVCIQYMNVLMMPSQDLTTQL